ncbi:MAG: LCP family protein [Solirubrobacterales bacterium]
MTPGAFDGDHPEDEQEDETPGVDAPSAGSDPDEQPSAESDPDDQPSAGSDPDVVAEGREPDQAEGSDPTSDDPTSDDPTSDDPTSDDPTPDDPTPDDPTPDDAAPDDPLLDPPPATWAGRQGWSGLPDEDEDEEGDGEDDAPDEEGDEIEVETGLTDEFDSLEQELADDLETELAGEHEIPDLPDPEPPPDPPAEALADEGPDPADEFEFDEEDEAEDAPPEAPSAGSDPEQPSAESDPDEEPSAESDPEQPSAESDPDEQPSAGSDPDVVAEGREPDQAEGSDPTSDDPTPDPTPDDPTPDPTPDDPAPGAVPAGASAAAGATTEVDTLAVADQEEAREAALEGLRNRTAEHTKKRGVTDPGKAPAPAAAADPQEAEDSDGEPEGAAAATAAAPAHGTPATASAEKPPRAGLWARFMAASFLIVASMAAATAVSILVYLTDIAKGLGGLPGLEDQLAEIDEDAQNFLIIGSDVRPDQSSKGLSDTTMLLRIDPDSNIITQLSIPRDLRVNIPGHGVDRFNAAYAYGGPKLTLEVVKQITGDRIPINHVVNVDFNGFADAVDAIGCVYMDIDRHYFNDNATAASFAEQYAEIDIQAGYQRLCGFKALQYVRYRHEDNDIVRAARQQGFLREARQKVPPGKLLDERDKLIEIFKDYTTSDINDSGTLVELFKLMLDARNAQITQVNFPFDSLDAQGYVTASDAPLRDAVDQFLGESGPMIGAPKPDAPEDGGDKSQDGEPNRRPDPEPKPEPKPQQSAEQLAAAEMIDATVAAQQYAAAIGDQGGDRLKFPILYPTRVQPGSMLSDDSRYFGIDGGDDKLYHGYKFVVSRPGSTYPTAYYGVSGTDWVNAPLFANPSERRKIGEREYLFFYDGGRLRMLAFQRGDAMYWVTNTLDKLLTEPQMIAIAQNLREAGT